MIETNSFLEITCAGQDCENFEEFVHYADEAVEKAFGGNYNRCDGLISFSKFVTFKQDHSDNKFECVVFYVNDKYDHVCRVQTQSHQKLDMIEIRTPDPNKLVKTNTSEISSPKLNNNRNFIYTSGISSSEPNKDDSIRSFGFTSRFIDINVQYSKGNR